MVNSWFQNLGSGPGSGAKRRIPLAKAGFGPVNRNILLLEAVG
jgi:hypothetical protein